VTWEGGENPKGSTPYLRPAALEFKEEGLCGVKRRGRRGFWEKKKMSADRTRKSSGQEKKIRGWARKGMGDRGENCKKKPGLVERQKKKETRTGRQKTWRGVAKENGKKEKAKRNVQKGKTPKPADFCWGGSSPETGSTGRGSKPMEGSQQKGERKEKEKEKLT